MKENANPQAVSPEQFSRRLAMLKTEVDLDVVGLVPRLETGTQVVLVTDPDLAKDLDPDVLRRIGGMTMLCRHYGAAVIFVNRDKVEELDGCSDLNP